MCVCVCVCVECVCSATINKLNNDAITRKKWISAVHIYLHLSVKLASVHQFSLLHTKL